MEWILIIWALGSKAGVTVPMQSQTACVEASKKIIRLSNYTARKTAFCVNTKTGDVQGIE